MVLCKDHEMCCCRERGGEMARAGTEIKSGCDFLALVLAIHPSFASRFAPRSYPIWVRC